MRNRVRPVLYLTVSVMSNRLRAGTISAVAVLVLVSPLLVWPKLAWACSVCASGRDEGARQAFLWTTGLLSALPPLMVGGLVWWLVRRARASESSHTARRAPDEWASVSGSSSSP